MRNVLEDFIESFLQGLYFLKKNYLAWNETIVRLVGAMPHFAIWLSCIFNSHDMNSFKLQVCYVPDLTNQKGKKEMQKAIHLCKLFCRCVRSLSRQTHPLNVAAFSIVCTRFSWWKYHRVVSNCPMFREKIMSWLVITWWQQLSSCDNCDHVMNLLWNSLI